MVPPRESGWQLRFYLADDFSLEILRRDAPQDDDPSSGRQLYPRRGARGGVSRGSGCLGLSAKKPRSSLRPMRRWAHSPSRIISAAAEAAASFFASATLMRFTFQS